MQGHSAVFSRIDPEAVLAQNLYRNLTVQLVILYQQNVFALEILALIGQQFFLLPGHLLAKGGHQRLAQVGHEHRLRAERRNTGGSGLHLNIRPVVGGQNNNRRIIAKAADLAGDLNAVHIRQTPVNDIRMESIAHLHRLPRTQHGLLAGKRPFRPHTHLDEHFGHAVAGVEIIIDHQRLHALQRCDLLDRSALRLDTQRHTDNKFRAFPLLRLNLYGAAHHVYDVFGDGHAKAGSLRPAHRGGALALKRLKDPFGKLRAHADAVILDADLILPAAALFTRKLLEPHRDRAAGRCKLDGIGQQVQKHLIQPGLIAVDILIGDIHCVHVQLKLLGVDLPADDSFQIVQHIGQVRLGLVQMDLAALDTAHIQHIVDKGKQVVARCEDLAQIVPHLILVVNIADSQRGKADDGVHRGADVVGHIGKEGALGTVGSFRCMNSLRERLIHLFVGGSVRHHKNVLAPALDLTAHGNIMEPAVFPCLLMNKIIVPFALLPAYKAR